MKTRTQGRTPPGEWLIAGHATLAHEAAYTSGWRARSQGRPKPTHPGPLLTGWLDSDHCIRTRENPGTAPNATRSPINDSLPKSTRGPSGA